MKDGVSIDAAIVHEVSQPIVSAEWPIHDQSVPHDQRIRLSRFDWPVSGPISSLMDDEHPLGIDIGLSARSGSVIRAVEDGRVEFAGGEECCGYGLYVIVEHEDGLKTVYAHLSDLDVAEGDLVSRSQQLGVSGATGASRGEHLHFEVRVERDRLDPMAFLPQPCLFIHPNDEYRGFAIDEEDCSPVPHEGLPEFPWPFHQVLGNLIARIGQSATQDVRESLGQLPQDEYRETDLPPVELDLPAPG